MFIVSQDRGMVVNADNVTNIFMSGSRLVARMVDSEEAILGDYKDRVGNVFEEMLKNVFPPSTLIFKNCMPDKENMPDFLDKRDLGAIFVSDHTDNADVKMYGCGVYYMPEK